MLRTHRKTNITNSRISKVRTKGIVSRSVDLRHVPRPHRGPPLGSRHAVKNVDGIGTEASHLIPATPVAALLIRVHHRTAIATTREGRNPKILAQVRKEVDVKVRSVARPSIRTFANPPMVDAIIGTEV